MKFSSIFSNTVSSSWLSFLVSQPLSFLSECQNNDALVIPLTFEKSFDTSHLFYHLCKFGILCQKFLDISCWHPRSSCYSLDSSWLLTEDLGTISAVKFCRQGSLLSCTQTVHCQSNYISISHIQKNKYKGKPPTRCNRCCHRLLCLPLIFKS